MKGAALRSQRDLDLRKWVGWHIAAMPLTKPGKFPKLRDFMRNEKATGAGRRQTPEQMLAIARVWHEQIKKGQS